MRRNGLALAVGAAASVTFLVACGGGDKGASGAADTTKTASAPPVNTNTAPPPSGAPATPATPTSGGGTAKPITGKTWDVKMIGDEKGYRFESASLTIKVGDGVKWTNVTGGPHNVAFSSEPPASKSQLDANMPAQSAGGTGPKSGELSSPLLVTPNDTYTISFAGVAPGKYDYFCTPHQALGMKGEITVQ